MAFVDVALAVGTFVGADALGATAATMVGGALIGGGAGALIGGLTGRDIGQSALMGAGLGAGVGGIGSAAGLGATAEAVPVSGAIAAPAAAEITPIASGFAGETTQAGMLAAQEAGMGIPQTQQAAMLAAQEAGMGSPAVSGGLNAADVEAQAGGFYGGQAPANPYASMSDSQIQNAIDTQAPSSSWAKMLADNKGLAAMGGTAALGMLMKQDNKKYGVPATASYSGPLSQLHYDPSKYTPTTVAQPSPAYQPVYANYRANPYTGAQGGVIKMATGGIAQAMPSGGPVELMSENNSVGQNQSFPQSQLQTPAFASATNTPTNNNLISATGDTNVDPYSGAEKFAEGGIAATPEAQAQAPQSLPSQITQNSVNTNNALMQQLRSAMIPQGQQAPVQQAPVQQAPVQQAPVQQAPVQQAPTYQEYATPTFTRLPVATTPFQNPKAIMGTKEYNDEQARIAALQPVESAAPSQEWLKNFGSEGGASGGLTQSYAAGGKTTSNMAAIDQYVNQYQTEATGPATVTAKAKGGDWNAMLAMNKIKGTPNQNYAHGGTAQSNLGGYSDGGRMLKGPGDGMSDNIPATIGGKQPARLADGEFVVPADVVSHLGNGSTDAGAKHLYSMMDKIRKARTGTKKQGKQIKADKFLPK